MSFNLIPLIILIALHGISLGISISEHGKPRSDGDAWGSIIGIIVQWSLIIWIIW